MSVHPAGHVEESFFLIYILEEEQSCMLISAGAARIRDCDFNMEREGLNFRKFFPHSEKTCV